MKCLLKRSETRCWPERTAISVCLLGLMACLLLSACRLVSQPGEKTPQPAPIGGEAFATPQLIQNGDFEADSGWDLPLTCYAAGYTTRRVFGGQRAMRVGIVSALENVRSYSSARQTVTIPSGVTSAELTVHLFRVSGEAGDVRQPTVPLAEDVALATLESDVQYLLVLNAQGQWIDTLLWQRGDDNQWFVYTFDLLGYAGQTVTLHFGVYNDGESGVTGLYIDDVALKVSPAETEATSTPTLQPYAAPPTETPTEAATDTPAPTLTETDAPTATAEPTLTDTPQPTETMTEEPTATMTATATSTVAPSMTSSPTLTATETVMPTVTWSPTPSDIDRATATPTATETPEPTVTESPMPTPTETAPLAPPPTATATATRRPTRTPSPTATETAVPTDTLTPTATYTAIPTNTATHTPTHTATVTRTPTNTLTPTRTPTRTSTPTMTPSPTPSMPWTFMIYMAGDNNLTYYFERAMRHIEALPPFSNVNIIVFMDSFGSNYAWYLEAQSGGSYQVDLNKWFLGEVNTGAASTLQDFVTWAHENYPAQHYYLSVADHGRGTQGIAYDDTSRKDHLTPTEVRSALLAATQNGAWTLDIVHYDACLMGMLEDAYQIRDLADYFVAYENLGWSIFAYEYYAAVAEKGGSPRDVAAGIAEAYYYHPSLSGDPRTVSAVDLAKIGAVGQRVDGLAQALISALPTYKNEIALARKNTQKFDTLDFYYLTQQDEYVDIYDLAKELYAAVPDSSVRVAAQAVMDVIEQEYVLVSYQAGGRMYGPGFSTYVELRDARGTSIYFPDQWGASEYAAYTKGDIFTFTGSSLWDEFLGEYFVVRGILPDYGVTPEVPPMLAPYK